MKRIITLLFTSFLSIPQLSCYEALCTVPVANLFLPSLEERYPEASAEALENVYEQFPLGNLNNRDCLRIHQLIFHETVTVLEENNSGEVLVEIKNAFFHNNPWTSQTTTYWTLKKYLTPIETIHNASLLPPALDYKQPESFFPPENTLFTLKEPFFDHQTNKLYSVRTRFTLLEQDKKNVIVACYNSSSNSMEPLTINKKHGVINELLLPHEAVNAIVNLLIEWTSTNDRFPSIRGGCSAREYVTPNNYQEGTFELPDQRVIGTFDRPECLAPYAGFDMPGMILSACQIYHAPYCAKNTVTAARYLRHIDHRNEMLECGDIILTKGYAGIVINLEKNLIAEARGHGFHYGAIRTVPLAQTFKGVKTYAQLVAQHQENKPLTLTDKDGKGLITLPFVILKMKSIFETNIWKKAKTIL